MTNEEKFMKNLMSVLESHAEAIEEIYSNQRRIAESLDEIADMNSKLIQAILRTDNVEIN